MNIYLQIGIGLLPGLAAAAFFLFKRKAFQLRKIMFSIGLLSVCGGLIFAGVREAVMDGAFARRLSREDMMAFANALALEGALDEASEVLEQYSEGYGYDDDCRLLTARLKLLRGDYESADGLYRYLVSESGGGLLESDAPEVGFAAAGAGRDMSELVMIQYLQSIGADLEAYGYTDAAYGDGMAVLQTDTGDIRREVEEAIKASYRISEAAEDCARAVGGVSGAFNSQENPDQAQDREAAVKYRRAFASVERDNPEFLALDCVKRARIKAYVMAGDYDSITEKINAGSSYHELMVAAELYMAGMVKKSDFDRNYQLIADRDAEAVRDQMDRIYDRVRDDLSRVERKGLKARISAISGQLGDPVLATLKERLAALVQDAGTDRTKVWLQLAKIENYFGNQTAADGYLREAIYSSQDCGDDSYASAMSRIIRVMENDGDGELENIKNVSDYVRVMLEHSLTVDVGEALSTEQQAFAGHALVEVAETLADAGFAQTAVDFVSRAMTAITIGRIDITAFPSVVSRVQISSDNLSGERELAKGISIYDCGVQITDFTLKKIDYSGSNIILLCDVSGSMQGSIQHLRDAVITFINDKNAQERLSVVTFSNAIVGTAEFGSSDESLTAFAESMYAVGGTDIFSAVVNCLGSFPSDRDANNVLIVMTDGQDGNRKDGKTIREQIGSLALSKGVTVYTVGLSEGVDTAYLNQIADSGNGEFVYVSDSASLTSFYNMLHQQVNSQYELAYEATDTMTMSGRTLEVTLPAEKTRDVKAYSVGAEDPETDGLEVTQGLSIAGLSPRYLYKGLQDVEVRLKGTGFKKDDAISVKLNGNIDYTLKAEFVDSETYRLTVPAGIAVGTYHVEVAIGSKKKVIQNGFSVIVPGKEKKTAFGPYVFTSAEQIENGDGSLTLRGAVTLNGWLRFKGDVSIAGDIEEGSYVSVSDYSGSYVEFDASTAEGIGSFLASKGISLDIPALRQFKLYNDPQNLYDYSKYMVQDISPGILSIHQLVRFDSPTIRLYPNSIGVYYSTGTTILPYQDKILGSAADDLFKFKFEGSAQITDKNVGIVIDASYDDPSNDNYSHQINLLNSPVYFNGSFAVKIDTLQNEYTLGAMVNLAFLAKQSGLGAEVSWKGRLIPDSVKLELELAKAVKLPTAFPIEVNDFSFMVSDINTAIEKGNFLSLMFTGSASFSSLKVKEYIPAMGKILGDMSLLEMPETTASIRISPFRLEADATLMFLSEIKLAEAGVKLGSFAYTNSLLQLDSADVTGLSAALKVGIMWDTADGRVSLELSGSGEIDAHTRFVGIDMTGTAAYDIGWWIIRSENKVTGEFALGLYTTHAGRQQFVFTYRTRSGNGKVKGKFYYIDENGKCGKSNGTLS